MGCEIFDCVMWKTNYEYLPLWIYICAELLAWFWDLKIEPILGADQQQI